MIPTDYQSFIHQSRYSRWLEDEARRETWEETVTRLLDFYKSFLKTNRGYTMPKELYTDLYVAIVTMQVMPSMRAMMTAGPALARNHIAAYNCSYLPVDSPRSFDECLYILMHGTGVGFSVERQYINQLPNVPDNMEMSETCIIVKDSKEGWFRAFKELINLLYAGQIPRWDMSEVRPAGAKLKTFGGRASGPGPLEELFHFSIAMFRNASGRKLTSLECHDMMCKIADVVVVGGVRRSALISLSNLSDDRMRHAKSGDWWVTEPHRSFSTNSVCYTGGLDTGAFLREWCSLYESKSGERGIFNRIAAQKQAAKYGRRAADIEYGTNPCSEIILRPKQFCNLSEVIVSAEDTLATLKDKVEKATILGTIQSCFTNFKGLGRQWVKNTEEERLLGVSLTGILDNEMLSNQTDHDLPYILSSLREHAVKVNAKYASALGIEPSAGITCVKPSGTVSQLVNSASGMHPRYSKYYLRRYRISASDPLYHMMKDQGVTFYPEVGPRRERPTTYVCEFGVESPDCSLDRRDFRAIDQLELYKRIQENWCEHNASLTVYVRDNEWFEVGNWVYQNWDIINGISFLPFDGGKYELAPYKEINKAAYEEIIQKMPKIDYTELIEFELEDTTTGAREYACVGGSCDI